MLSLFTQRHKELLFHLGHFYLYVHLGEDRSWRCTLRVHQVNGAFETLEMAFFLLPKDFFKKPFLYDLPSGWHLPDMVSPLWTDSAWRTWQSQSPKTWTSSSSTLFCCTAMPAVRTLWFSSTDALGSFICCHVKLNCPKHARDHLVAVSHHWKGVWSHLNSWNGEERSSLEWFPNKEQSWLPACQP